MPPMKCAAEKAAAICEAIASPDSQLPVALAAGALFVLDPAAAGGVQPR